MHHPFAVTDRAIPNPFAGSGVAAEKLNPVSFMKIIKKFMKILKKIIKIMKIILRIMKIIKIFMKIIISFMKISKRSIFPTFWKTHR